MQIIMLGKIRSGKTTVSGIIKDYVEEILNIELKSKPLAAPIYAEAKSMYAKHGLTWRKNRRLLEGIGEALNDDYPKGDKIVELYKENYSSSDDIFVEDCRRQTQADFFKSNGAIFVRVLAEEETRKSRCKKGEWATGHVTDTELDGFPADFVINNNGVCLAELRTQVYLKVIKELEEKYGTRTEETEGDSIRLR